MSHIIPEASPYDLQTIRAQVFLADTKDLLEQTHRKFGVTLKYKIEPNAGRGNDPSNYVEAWVAGEYRTQCYIHPMHGDPKSVAYMLSCTLKPVQLAGR